MSFSRNENCNSTSTKEVLSQDFDMIDHFFENVDFNQWNFPSSIASATMFDDKFICQKDLGGNVFLRAHVFKKNVKIHIRKFLISKDHEMVATTDGVCLTPYTFYRLLQKIPSFNLEYTSASFIANNSLLVLNENGMCFIQEMRNMKHIILDFHQLQTLKTEIFDFSETLLNFLFVEYLPKMISIDVPVSENCAESDLTQYSKIISCIENELSTKVLKKEFICTGCIAAHNSQLRHECMKLRNLEKFQNLGNDCLFCIDFSSVVSSFKEQTSVISQNFLCNFTLDSITDVLFKTPEDI